jgi:hypothetical protein
MGLRPTKSDENRCLGGRAILPAAGFQPALASVARLRCQEWQRGRQGACATRADADRGFRPCGGRPRPPSVARRAGPAGPAQACRPPTNKSAIDMPCVRMSRLPRGSQKVRTPSERAACHIPVQNSGKGRYRADHIIRQRFGAHDSCRDLRSVRVESL